MINKRRIFLIVLFILSAALFIYLGYAGNKFPRGLLLDANKNRYPNLNKLTLIYDVKFGNVRLGKASLYEVNIVQQDGIYLRVIKFQTELARFKDTETIYADPQTFLPLRIERDIANWFSREKIVEEYDQKDFTLAITKSNGNGSKSKTTIVKKTAPISNAILLAFRLGSLKDINYGYVFNATLPNREFKINLVSIENINVPKGVFRAYRFESEPKQIKIWVSYDENRLPLKIEGMGNFGYSLELKRLERSL